MITFSTSEWVLGVVILASSIFASVKMLEIFAGNQFPVEGKVRKKHYRCSPDDGVD